MPHINNVRLAIDTQRPPLRPPAEPQNPLLEVRVSFDAMFPPAEANGSLWSYTIEMMGADWPNGVSGTRADQHLFNLAVLTIRRDRRGGFLATFLDHFPIYAIEGTTPVTGTYRIHKGDLDEDPPIANTVRLRGDYGFDEFVLRIPKIDDVFARVVLDGGSRGHVTRDSNIVRRFFDVV